MLQTIITTVCAKSVLNKKQEIKINTADKSLSNSFYRQYKKCCKVLLSVATK